VGWIGSAELTGVPSSWASERDVMSSSQLRSSKPPGRVYFVALVVLTLLALCSAVAVVDSQLTVLECAGNLQLLPEPANWRAWPAEKDGVRQGSPYSTLFGFEYHARARDFRIGGYETTELVDAALCPNSDVELSSWFDAGEHWRSRSADELSLYRNDATGVFVLAGIQADDLATERARPSFVTAFRRDLRPQTFVVDNDLDFPVAPLFVVAAVGAGVLRARYKARKVYDARVRPTVFLGFAALLATFALALVLAFRDAAVAG
jgi:hypothetical protein